MLSDTPYKLYPIEEDEDYYEYEFCQNFPTVGEYQSLSYQSLSDKERKEQLRYTLNEKSNHNYYKIDPCTSFDSIVRDPMGKSVSNDKKIIEIKNEPKEILIEKIIRKPEPKKIIIKPEIEEIRIKVNKIPKEEDKKSSLKKSKSLNLVRSPTEVTSVIKDAMIINGKSTPGLSKGKFTLQISYPSTLTSQDIKEQKSFNYKTDVKMKPYNLYKEYEDDVDSEQSFKNRMSKVIMELRNEDGYDEDLPYSLIKQSKFYKPILIDNLKNKLNSDGIGTRTQ